VFHVDVEHTLEQPCPADATGPRLGGLSLVIAGKGGFGGLVCSATSDPCCITRARSLAFGAGTP